MLFEQGRPFFIMTNGQQLALYIDGQVVFLEEALIKSVEHQIQHDMIDTTVMGAGHEYIQGPMTFTLDVSFLASGQVQVYQEMTHEELCRMLGFTEGMSVRQLLSTISKKMDQRKP